jgi:hypothetical protein
MSDEANAGDPEGRPGPEIFKCSICGKDNFTSARYLKTHMTAKHSGKKKPTDGPADSGVETATPPPADPPPEVPESTPPPSRAVKSKASASEAAAQVSEVAAVPPATPPGTPPAPQLDLPVGSILQLEGPTWRQDAVTGEWTSAVVLHLVVEVLSKSLSAGDVMLLCRAEGDPSTWAVQQAYALSGAVTILKVASPVSPVPPAGPPPIPGTPVQSEPAEDPEKVRAEQEEQERQRIAAEEQKRLEEEERKRAAEAEHQKRNDLAEFKLMASTYLEKQEAFSLAQRDFESYSSAYTKHFSDCIQKYGSEGCLEAEGFVVQISDDFESPFQDEAGLIEWCQESGNDDLLTLKLDKVKWAEFKRSAEANSDPGAAALEAIRQHIAKLEGEPLKKLSILKL